MNIAKDFFNILKNGGSAVWRTIAIFLLLDILFIGIYMAYGMLDVVYHAGKMPLAWNLAEENSASEIFNYMKWLFICASLAIAYTRTRIPLFLSFSFVFALILFDDMMQIHERGGAFFVQSLDFVPAFGLRAQDFGELATWAILGLVSLSALVFGYFKSPAKVHPLGSYFFVILCALVFTAMGLDMLNAWDGLNEETALNNILIGIITIAEDGGEMIVGSFGCGGAVAALLASKTEKFSVNRYAAELS